MISRFPNAVSQGNPGRRSRVYPSVRRRQIMVEYCLRTYEQVDVLSGPGRG